MESPDNGQNHLLDNLLNDDCHPHQIFAFNNPELDVDNQEKKNITGSKKKGRPKGLKTNKGKCSSKEESKDEKLNKGHWLQEQNKNKHFIQKQLRRMDKIFKTMAQFIGSRQAQQCRSHHQKMQKKYHSFYKIIRNLRFQFFSSADPVYIKNELQGNQIYDYDPLIPEQALENQNQIVQVDDEKQYEKECDLSLGKNNNNQNHSFMLGDNYQNSLKYQSL